MNSKHTERCRKKVSDHTGFHFSPCGRPAKYRVSFGDGPALPYCGIHANAARRRLNVIVVPLTDDPKRTPDDEAAMLDRRRAWPQAENE